MRWKWRWLTSADAPMELYPTLYECNDTWHWGKAWKYWVKAIRCLVRWFAVVLHRGTWPKSSDFCTRAWYWSWQGVRDFRFDRLNLPCRSNFKWFYRSLWVFGYVGFGNDLFLVEIDVKHDLFIGDVSVIKLAIIECREDCMVLFGISDQIVLFFVLVSAIENDVMLALLSVLVSFDVANKHKLGVFGCVDAVPLLCQQWLRLFLHKISNIITHFKLKHI